MGINKRVTVTTRAWHSFFNLLGIKMRGYGSDEYVWHFYRAEPINDRTVNGQNTGPALQKRCDFQRQDIESEEFAKGIFEDGKPEPEIAT